MRSARRIVPSMSVSVGEVTLPIESVQFTRTTATLGAGTSSSVKSSLRVAVHRGGVESNGGRHPPGAQIPGRHIEVERGALRLNRAIGPTGELPPPPTKPSCSLSHRSRLRSSITPNRAPSVTGRTRAINLPGPIGSE